MTRHFIIIGGGPAGYATARSAAKAGAGSVLLIEQGALGGTCTNRGCIPTKFLLARAASAGPGGTAEWAKMVAHKNSLVQGLSRSIGATCARAGVRVVQGRARLAGPDAVEVSTHGGGTEEFRASAIVIAAGSEPAALAGVRFDGERLISSTDALDLVSLPESLAVVGSGAVGSEFAFMFHRFGVAVTLLEAAERLFPQEDPEVDALFRKVYDRIGIRFVTGDGVVGAERSGSGVSLGLRSGAGIDASMALVGVGRRLATGDMGCERAGVARGSRGEIVVDEELRTSVPGVYAAGDATGRMLLAHAASYQGECAARRALGLPFPPVPYRSIPWATYTSPEVASVGTTAAAAERAGIPHAAALVPFMSNVKSRIDRETEGFVKVVADRGSGRLIGGTIVGAHAAELIHVISFAVHRQLTVDDLRGFCIGHPTATETIADALAELQTLV